MPEFSIVTIVKGRRKQLENLLQSVKSSTVLPSDIQIVFMDDPRGTFFPDGLNVKIHQLNSSQELPLAAARNFGINATQTENIVFIDVDCIVSPTLFESLLGSLEDHKIISAYPKYLPTVPDEVNYKDIENQAVAHPSRENIPAGKPVDHLQFWSLIFAVTKNTFNKIGGFDETFAGYGAEDTDFAMSFHRKGIEHIFAADFILHQYHDKYDPPLNYFDSIIANARRYHQKWNVLPMQKWLRAFENLGLIKISENQEIQVLSKPSEVQIKNCLSKLPY